MDEPGSDAMGFWSESHQILFHACEILAGQLYSDQTFTNVGQTGQWHQEKGERLALTWLRQRATGGFREWDSNSQEALLALSHLVDLAENPQVWELAAVLMDEGPRADDPDRRVGALEELVWRIRAHSNAHNRRRHGNGVANTREATKAVGV